jgi:3-hydroxyisobutyrate dehydrogenase-like beta-hydroxyacid dehydrogenase
MRTAFIGLGVMGYPMAGYLAGAGHEVTVFNRTGSKAQTWANEYAGETAATPAAAASGADIVFTCVGNDDDVREVAILVDHTTASARLARELYETAAKQGVGFLDAPLSGGQAGAENGQLTIMVGGDEDVFERARPVMDCYAKAITLIGPAGHGQMAKMVNQICIAGAVQGLAEGLHFAMKADLDVQKVIEAISKGAAQSWQMENRWQTMINGEFEFGFAVDWMRKDLAIALEEAKENGVSLEMTELVDRISRDIDRIIKWEQNLLNQMLNRRGKQYETHDSNKHLPDHATGIDFIFRMGSRG